MPDDTAATWSGMPLANWRRISSGAEANPRHARVTWEQLVAEFERRQAVALPNGRLLATPWRPVPAAEPGPPSALGDVFGRELARAGRRGGGADALRPIRSSRQGPDRPARHGKTVLP